MDYRELIREATPSGDLEFQIVNNTVPKNEREWWAHREIERLRNELAEARAEIERLQKYEDEWARMSQDEGKAEREIERLRVDRQLLLGRTKEHPSKTGYGLTTTCRSTPPRFPLTATQSWRRRGRHVLGLAITLLR